LPQGIQGQTATHPVIELKRARENDQEVLNDILIARGM
jgi:hypothetical protein